MRYVPRNDFVLLRIVDLGKVRGVHVPEVSAQGKQLHVMAIGPQVEDLRVGDVVLAVGSPGQDWVRLPDDRDLVLTKQSNVMVVVQDDGFPQDARESSHG